MFVHGSMLPLEFRMGLVWYEDESERLLVNAWEKLVNLGFNMVFKLTSSLLVMEEL